MSRRRHREPEPTGALATVDLTVTYRNQRAATIWVFEKEARSVVAAREAGRDFVGSILDVQATKDEGRMVLTSLLLEDVVEITIRERGEAF